MSERPLTGRGVCDVAAAPQTVWSTLLDPKTLEALIPGVERVELDGNRYEAWLSYGAGRLRSNYHVDLELSELRPPHALLLSGQSQGRLGWGRAEATVELTPNSQDGTTINWRYAGIIGGPVSSLGGFVLRSAARVFVGRFFNALGRFLRP